QAYRLLENAAPLALEVRPKPAVTLARQALTYFIDATQMRAELEALVNVQEGAVFQHTLSLPAGWEVDRATLHEGDAARHLRVASASSGAHTLFLPEGIDQEHRLVIRLQGPTTPRAAWTLPDIGLSDPNAEAPVVFLERTDHVRLK